MAWPFVPDLADRAPGAHGISGAWELSRKLHKTNLQKFVQNSMKIGKGQIEAPIGVSKIVFLNSDYK